MYSFQSRASVHRRFDTVIFRQEQVTGESEDGWIIFNDKYQGSGHTVSPGTAGYQREGSGCLGRRTLKTDPRPKPLSTSTVPPNAETNPFTIESPKPLPSRV